MFLPNDTNRENIDVDNWQVMVRMFQSSLRLLLSLSQLTLQEGMSEMLHRRNTL